MQTTAFRKATFVLDACEDEEFEGYTQGETWNGFACPYFTLENAQQLMLSLNAEGLTAFYDEGADQFVCATAEDEEEKDADRYGALEVEGLGKLYPIGVRIWTWGISSHEENI